MDSETSKLISATVEDLKSAGANIENATPPFFFKDSDDVTENYLTPHDSGAPQETLDTIDEIAKTVEDNDMSSMAKTARGATLLYRDWVLVNAKRQFMRQQWRAFFENYDVILCPVWFSQPLNMITDLFMRKGLKINGKKENTGIQLYGQVRLLWLTFQVQALP
ncbi:MAG: hypothetical protein CM1200mP12_21090 [Gammaproteobacteria bacterium]|nr:MAG: hypothetical protein CM1200mP12_21090 [Gammaproteobacteria bacterium]